MCVKEVEMKTFFRVLGIVVCVSLIVSCVPQTSAPQKSSPVALETKRVDEPPSQEPPPLEPTEEAAQPAADDPAGAEREPTRALQCVQCSK